MSDADVPDDIAAYAAGLVCSDCGGRARPSYQDAHGDWHIQVTHDPTCPRLVSGRPDRDAMARAAASAAAVVTTPTVLTVTDPRGDARERR